MPLKYKKVIRRPKAFIRLFGIDIANFQKIMKKIHCLWKANIINKYKAHGRSYKLSLEDMLLMTMLYYRSYSSQFYIGCIFGLDDSNVCRVIRKIEKILVKIVHIDKSKNKLTEEEMNEIIIDATEQQIERPENNQRSYYSGKKKNHGVKTTVGITKKKRIIYISKSYPASNHDYAIYKQNSIKNRDAIVRADSGYQGLTEIHPNAIIPYKKSKNKKLTEEQKKENRLLAKVRVLVENTLASIKKYRILCDKYRNKLNRYNIKFQIIAGIINIRNGFA